MQQRSTMGNIRPILSPVLFSAWYFPYFKMSRATQRRQLGSCVILEIVLAQLSKMLHCWTCPYLIFMLSERRQCLSLIYLTLLAEVKGPALWPFFPPERIRCLEQVFLIQLFEKDFIDINIFLETYIRSNLTCDMIFSSFGEKLCIQVLRAIILSWYVF